MFWIEECSLHNFSEEQNEQKNVSEHATGAKSFVPHASGALGQSGKLQVVAIVIIANISSNGNAW